MTAHVFVVDIKTFPLHLRHRFAGTGAREYNIDFNDSSHSSLNPNAEITLAGMIADINRIRKGDSIIFYVQQQQKAPRMPEGKFYGIFRATEDYPFLDNNDDEQFLKDSLDKSLTFRTLFKPDRVYPEGVTEWEALDEIKGISKPNQMVWSLIYRKLKGNRGCTMITEYEQDRLYDLLDRKNQGTALDCDDQVLNFNLHTQRIFCKDEIPSIYPGRQEPINLLPRLAQKHRIRRSFEAHLQAEIVGGLGRKTDALSQLLIGDCPIEWLGNEVSCGVGMQKIDVMFASIKDGIRYVTPIELKSVPIQAAHIRQVQRYVDWIQQYYIPNLPSIISPTLITLKSQNILPQAVRQEIQRFNDHNSGSTCERLRIVEFEVRDSELSFSLHHY
jgi:hypothetical protein